MRYAKLGAMVVATILVAVIAALAAGPFTLATALGICVVGVGALSVFAAPNVPGARYTKSILAVASAVLTVLVTAPHGFSTPEILECVVAGLGALGVYAIPNATANQVAEGS